MAAVRGHLLRLQFINGTNPRHVAVMAPAGQVALLVTRETAEATVGDHAADALVERGDEHAVMSAQGMAQHADALRIDLGQALQQVHTTAVVPDALHGGADIARLVGIDLVIAGVDVVRSQGDVAALHQVQGVAAVLFRPQPRGHDFAKLALRRMEAKHGRQLAGHDTGRNR